MKRLANYFFSLAMITLFIKPSFAQSDFIGPLPSNGAMSVAEVITQLPQWRLELDELRAKPQEFKKFVFEVLKRRLASDLSVNMLRAGYSEQDIDETLRSDSFQKFTVGVLAQESVKDMVDETLYEIMTPGVLEKSVERKHIQYNEYVLEQQRQSVKQMTAYQHSSRVVQKKFNLWVWIKSHFEELSFFK